MGDEGDFWRDVKAARKERRRLLGVPCPTCLSKGRWLNATILMPGQQCRVDGYKDPRVRDDDTEAGVRKGPT